LPSVTQWTHTSGTPPQPSTEPAEPLGFGSTTPALNFDFGSSLGNYNPLDNKRQPVPPAGKVQDREQFNINFSQDSLPDIGLSLDNYVNNGYPIANFELVYIDKAFLSELQGSK